MLHNILLEYDPRNLDQWDVGWVVGSCLVSGCLEQSTGRGAIPIQVSFLLPCAEAERRCRVMRGMPIAVFLVALMVFCEELEYSEPRPGELT